MASDKPPVLTELMRAPPAQVPVTVLLIAFNVLVFVALAAAGGGWWHAARGVQLDWGANFAPATQDGQWWRLASAMFIHFGVWHLVLNMWALWDSGRLLETLMGRWRFALLYLGSGVCGNLLSLVVQGNRAVSGGASGAVFGLYGALLVFLWTERKRLETREFRWLFGGALGFSALMLGLGWVLPGIDNAAHGGGLFAGMLWAGVLLRPGPQHPAVPRRRAVWSAVALLSAVLYLWLVLPAPAYRLGEERRARATIERFLLDNEVLSARWADILRGAEQGQTSFDTIAGRIDTEVVQPYQASFESLLQATPQGGAPSAAALSSLQTYAAQRAQAAHAQAEQLRQGRVPAAQVQASGVLP
jgi:rhomboid protease GluP